MTEFLRCLILSTDHTLLLLPYSAVAEIIPFQEKNLLENASNTLVSMIEWRGLQIPLLTYTELEKSEKKFTLDDAQHIIIFNRLIETPGLKFFGLILNQMPRMLRLKRADIHMIDNPNKPYLLAEVMVREQKAFIPNINWIEKKIVEAMATIAGPVGQST